MSAPPTLRQRAATGMRWTLLASAVTAGTQLLQLVVLARVLSPLDFGVIGVLLIVVGIVQAYTDLGLSAALIHRRNDTREERSSLYWLNVLAGVVIALAALLAVPLIAHVFNEDRLEPYLRAIAVVFLIVALGKQFEVLLQKELAFRQLGLIESAAATAGALTAIVACGLLDAGVWGFVAGVLVTQLLKTVILGAVGFRRFRPARHFRLRDTRSYLGFGAYQMADRTLNSVSERIDQILVGGALGTTTLGFYNFAWNVTTQPVSRINPIVTRVAFPALAVTQDDLPRMRRGYLEMTRLLATVNAPLLLGLAAIAPTLVPVVFGDKWNESVDLVQILCVASLARTVMNPVGSLMLARGRADLGFKWNAGVMVVTVPAILVGLELGDARGVALGLTLVHIGQQVLGFRFLVRPLLDVSARAYFGALLRPVSLALLMAALVVLLPSLVPAASDAGLLPAQIALGAITYLLLVWRLHPQLLRELISVARGRAV